MWSNGAGNGSTVSYKIDGQEIHRLNRSVLDDLHRLLRLPQVNPPDGSDSFDVHFAEQSDRSSA